LARASEHTNSIFQEPWWLDAVAPGRWSAAELSKNGKVYARLPYCTSRKLGLNCIVQPRLTQTLGPWLAPSNDKPALRLGKEKEWLSELARQLPPFDYFKQNWHYSMQNWLPFHWLGFECSPRFTYVLEDLSDLERVWRGYHEKTQREIKKAQKSLEVCTDLGVDVLWKLVGQTFGRQDKDVPYTRDLVERLDAACSANDARRMYFAKDAQGRVHAALYLVWDERSAYYLMSGSDPELRNSGALRLLVHEAIAFAATKTQRFDFEGSMIEPVERFCRNFGAVQKQYFTVSGYSRRMRLVQGLRDIFRGPIAKPKPPADDSTA
jgi:hypothetical protein